MRSGDLGFLHDGELFILAGSRSSDHSGTQPLPQDPELTAESCSDKMRPGCSAAFSVPVEGQEVLVVVGEVRDDKFKNIKRDAPEVADAVRASLAADHGVAVHAVVLIKHHTVPKTTSGKIKLSRKARVSRWQVEHCARAQCWLSICK